MIVLFFFFKQKTAYEMRISDWSSDVCSSDLLQIIEMIDQVRNTRTGVTETNSALNAESLAKGAVGSEGVQSMMQAGAQRQKLIAREIGRASCRERVCQYV